MSNPQDTTLACQGGDWGWGKKGEGSGAQNEPEGVAGEEEPGEAWLLLLPAENIVRLLCAVRISICCMLPAGSSLRGPLLCRTSGRSCNISTKGSSAGPSWHALSSSAARSL